MGLDAEGWGIAVSLALLTSVLTILAGRGFVRFFRTHRHSQLGWGVGLAFGGVATAIELAAYVGVVSSLMLQAYVFFSAAIVGTLSLGSVRAFRRPVYRNLYAGYIIAVSAVVGLFCFLTPVPASMVQSGVISGNPPVFLLVLSSFITVPATIVLLGFAVVSLRRSFHWKGLLMIAGASVLAAGGAFYIASFPVALYYAEFIGIVLLFIGLTDFSRWLAPTAAPVAVPSERTA
ncbi:MAG TPA: hypothetical protein VEG42_01775 [Thermoplasmata archaeon]|nr:hypothetical protein [Thermoplasmata archaeon]